LVIERGYVSLKGLPPQFSPPDHLPKNIENIFNEGAKVRRNRVLHNAAGTMFRPFASILATQATAS